MTQLDLVAFVDPQNGNLSESVVSGRGKWSVLRYRWDRNGCWIAAVISETLVFLCFASCAALRHQMIGVLGYVFVA